MKNIKLDRKIFETDIANNPKIPVCYAIMLTEPYGLFESNNNNTKFYFRTSMRFLSERLYEYGINNITITEIKNILIELQKLDICRFYDSKFQPLSFNTIGETFSPNHRHFSSEAIHFESVLENNLLYIEDNKETTVSYFTVNFNDIKKILSFKNNLNGVKVINSVNAFLRIVSSINTKTKYSYISYDNIIPDIGIKSFSSINKYISFLSEINVLKYTNAGVFIKSNHQGRIKSNNIYTLASNDDFEQILENAVEDVKQKMLEHNWLPYGVVKQQKEAM